MSEIKPVAEVRDGGIIYPSGALAIGSKLYGAEAVQQLQRENAELHHSNTYLQNATNAQSIGFERLRVELAAAKQEIENMAALNAVLLEQNEAARQQIAEAEPVAWVRDGNNFISHELLSEFRKGNPVASLWRNAVPLYAARTAQAATEGGE